MPAVNDTNAIMPAVNGTYGTMAVVTPTDFSWTYPNTIVSALNGMCIDSYQGNQGLVYMFSCQGWNKYPYSGAQVFRRGWADSVVVSATGNCLDVYGGNLYAGARVGIYKCQSSNNQKWYYNSVTGQVKAGWATSNWCLDIIGGNKQAGTGLQIWSCHNGANQRWFPNTLGWFNYKWDHGPWNGPYGADIYAAFGGWPTLKLNLRPNEVPKFSTSFGGAKFITVGGGVENTGKWRQTDIQANINDMWMVKANGYDGIGIDIEYGDWGLDFSQLFRAAKNQGLQVFVTVGHNAPFIGDACNLMEKILADYRNINFIVPQMYSNKDAFEEAIVGGTEACGWDKWKSTSIPIVPVLWKKGYEWSASNWAAKWGIKLSGYMVWTKW
jgi:hypothetical protein